MNGNVTGQPLNCIPMEYIRERAERLSGKRFGACSPMMDIFLAILQAQFVPMVDEGRPMFGGLSFAHTIWNLNALPDATVEASIRGHEASEQCRIVRIRRRKVDADNADRMFTMGQYVLSSVCRDDEGS